jgi:hypothetical protein
LNVYRRVPFHALYSQWCASTRLPETERVTFQSENMKKRIYSSMRWVTFSVVFATSQTRPPPLRQNPWEGPPFPLFRFGSGNAEMNGRGEVRRKRRKQVLWQRWAKVIQKVHGARRGPGEQHGWGSRKRKKCWIGNGGSCYVGSEERPGIGRMWSNKGGQTMGPVTRRTTRRAWMTSANMLCSVKYMELSIN